VSFIVVYRGAGAGSSCEELGTLDDAVRFVERIRNDAGVSDAQIFRAEPVPFDFRPYFRVEIADAPVGLPKPTRYSRDMLLAPDDASQLERAVPAMEAAPVDPAPAGSDGVDAPGRGLFGR
jgi:hypothetical protein